MIAPVRARAALAARVALAPPAHTEVPCAYHPSTATGLRGLAPLGARRAEQSRWKREQKGKPPLAQSRRLAWIAGLEVRYLAGEQNPVHLGRCQYFLAIELFSSGTKG